jgi:hypothetical protein
MAPLAAKLHDGQPCIVVGAVDEAAGIDEYVGRLNDAGAVRPAIHLARWRGRHQRACFAGPKRIADVEHAHARILIRRKMWRELMKLPGRFSWILWGPK